MRPGTEMFLNADGRLTDGADITLSGRLFQMVGPATGKARPLTVDSFMGGTSIFGPPHTWLTRIITRLHMTSVWL